MSAAADTDGSGFKSQGAYDFPQYSRVCVVPRMIAPRRGHSKLQGADHSFSKVCGSTPQDSLQTDSVNAVFSLSSRKPRVLQLANQPATRKR